MKFLPIFIAVLLTIGSCKSTENRSRVLKASPEEITYLGEFRDECTVVGEEQSRISNLVLDPSTKVKEFKLNIDEEFNYIHIEFRLQIIIPLKNYISIVSLT